MVWINSRSMAELKETVRVEFLWTVVMCALHQRNNRKREVGYTIIGEHNCSNECCKASPLSNTAPHFSHHKHNFKIYSRPSIARTLDTSDLGPIPQYLGLGPICAAFCLTLDLGIQSPRCSTPHIGAGKFCPGHSEVFIF